MTDYKTMYAILCGAISDAIDVLNAGFLQTDQMTRARTILTEALNQAEDIYCETCLPQTASPEIIPESLDISTLTC